MSLNGDEDVVRETWNQLQWHIWWIVWCKTSQLLLAVVRSKRMRIPDNERRCRPLWWRDKAAWQSAD